MGVVFVVSPAYVFDEHYDDSIILDYTWDQPERLIRKVREYIDSTTSLQARREAENRIQIRKGK